MLNPHAHTVVKKSLELLDYDIVGGGGRVGKSAGL